MKNEGLTVGELVITIAVLILVSLIWSTVRKKQEGNVSFLTTSESQMMFERVSIQDSL